MQSNLCPSQDSVSRVIDGAYDGKAFRGGAPAKVDCARVPCLNGLAWNMSSEVGELESVRETGGCRVLI